mgnify:CR=1 FL=1
MKGTVKTITMNKGTRTFKVWADFIMRCTYAEDENGEVVKRIREYKKTERRAPCALFFFQFK